jgi:hypothetical protein
MKVNKMAKEKFNVIINASKEKIWQILWNDATYRKWTTPFTEGSYMESDWKVGGKTLFLDGKGNGMVSTIDQIKENEILSFKHVGILKDRMEDLESEEAKKWAGAFETYTLEKVEENTKLSVELDMDETHKEYFMRVFPIALSLVKELSEK